MAESVPLPSTATYAPVVSTIQASLGSNPTGNRLQEIITSLPDKQIASLANVSWACELSRLTRQEKEVFQRRFIEKLTSAEARNHMQYTAKTAADACAAIDDAFEVLVGRLMSLEDFDEAYRTLGQIRQRYRKILHQSHEHAVEIATYGELFGQIILPLCDDPTISNKVKLRKLDEFIAKADKFKDCAKSFSDQFQKINDDLVELTGTFDKYGKGTETADMTRITELQKEIDKLQDSLNSVARCLLFDGALGLLSGGTVYGLARFCVGTTFLTPLTLACCVGGGVVVGLMAYQAYQNACINKTIKEKTAEKARLEESMDGIQRTRISLVELGNTTKTEFGESIKVLTSVWNFAKNDATELKTLLEHTKGDLDLPKRYLMNHMGNTAGVYMQLSVYLRAYADGIRVFATYP